MKYEAEINLTPKQIAEQIHGLDTVEISKVFTEWAKLVSDQNKKDRNEGSLNFWRTLTDVFIYMDNAYESNDAFLELTRNLYVSSLIHMDVISEESFNKLTK